MGYCTIFGTVAHSFYDTIFTLIPASHLLPAQKAVLLVFPLQMQKDPFAPASTFQSHPVQSFHATPDTLKANAIDPYVPATTRLPADMPSQ